MVNQELEQLLVKFGVDKDTAQQLQNNINGNDLINLVNSLESTNRHDAIAQAQPILQKYGISLHESNLEKSANKIEWLKELRESSSIEDRLIALEGYNYYTHLDTKLGEELIDWLNNNKVQFLTNGEGHFHIKCEDRNHAYKVGRVISGLVRKQKLVRDSQTLKSRHTDMNEADRLKKRIKVAKDKLDNFKPRDPNALNARFMQAKNGGPNDSQADRKLRHADKFDRKTKHKGASNWVEEIDYKIGEQVIYRDHLATVSSTVDNNGKIQLEMNGTVSSVDGRDISRLDETISGVTGIAPLFRLRELAGLPPAPNNDMVSPLGRGAVANRFLDPEDDMPVGLEDDDVDLNMSGPDMTDGYDSSDTSLDMPNSMPVATDVMPNGNIDQYSDAMNMIKNHLNNVQLLLPDIRLSEYKTLVQQLQSLTQQVQFMGRDYLGERKK